MIKLSSLLEHILEHPMKGEAIQEAKRLERIDECDRLTHLEITPDVSNTELKPLLGDYTKNPLYILLTRHGGSFLDFSSDPVKVREWQNDGRNVVQVMQPDTNGNCPTQCVYTPEREHEWAIFRPSSYHKLWSWAARIPDGGYWWCNDLLAPSILKFTSSKEAQEYIDNAQKQHYNIDMLDAFPWAIPKLSEK